jgi:hypothetical protein
VTVVGLSPADESKVLADLEYWEDKGTWLSFILFIFLAARLDLKFVQSSPVRIGGFDFLIFLNIHCQL